MATQQLQLVCDSSNSTNFNAWAKPISDWFRSCGYTNTSDSGQLNGVGGGHGGSAGWAALSTVPGSGAYYYEVFQSNGSGLTQFLVKVEYGNTSGTNAPNTRLTLCTTTNGAGTPTGFFTSALSVAINAITPPSTSTQYECNFTGDSANDRIGVMMWRNAPANQGQMLFAIERSLDSSGNATSDYVTLFTCGNQTTNVSGKHQSLVFGVGAGNIAPDRSQISAPTGWVARGFNPVPLTTAYNGSLCFDTCSPIVAGFGRPCTMVGVGYGPDFAEGVPFTVTLYGSTRTYMPGKISPFAQVSTAYVNGQAVLFMRYD